MSSTNKPISVEDEALLGETEQHLDSDAPSLFVFKEEILEVLRALLVESEVRKRVRIVLTPEKTTALEGKLYNNIAAVISQTYAELGDVAPLADDEALKIIRDLLRDFDSWIISRNSQRRFSRRTRGRW